MSKRKLKVVVFYGGDAATNPRNELLAWLRRDTMDVSAKIVSDHVAHSKGAIDTRVDDAILEADKAIAILTPDGRSPPGAPNVIDEIGRWRGKRGAESICIVRQEGVEPYSNHHGLPYILFKGRIKEGFDQIRDFLLAEIEKPKKRQVAKPATKATVSGTTTYAGNNGTALIDGRLYRRITVQQARGQLTIELSDVKGADEGALRQLEDTHGDIKVTYGSNSALIRLGELSFTSAKKLRATLVGRLREDRSNSSLEYATVIDGRQVSADELATMRASRIISNIPASRNRSARLQRIGNPWWKLWHNASRKKPDPWMAQGRST